MFDKIKAIAQRAFSAVRELVFFVLAYLFARNVENLVFDTIGNAISVVDGTTAAALLTVVAFVAPMAVAYFGAAYLYTKVSELIVQWRVRRFVNSLA